MTVGVVVVHKDPRLDGLGEAEFEGKAQPEKSAGQVDRPGVVAEADEHYDGDGCADGAEGPAPGHGAGQLAHLASALSTGRTWAVLCSVRGTGVHVGERDGPDESCVDGEHRLALEVMDGERPTTQKQRKHASKRVKRRADRCNRVLRAMVIVVIELPILNFQVGTICFRCGRGGMHDQRH